MMQVEVHHDMNDVCLCEAAAGLSANLALSRVTGLRSVPNR